MQPTVTAGSGLFSQGNAANTKSRTDARRMSTYSRWPMLRTTATSCLNRFGTVLTSLVSRSAARPVAPLLSTGRRGNSCVSPTQSTPVTTSTRHPSLKPSIAAQVQFSALPAGASTTRPRTPTTGLRSSSSRATGRSPRIGPGAAPTARSARSTSVWTSLAPRLPAERRFSFGTATAQPLRNGAGDNRPDS
jgi:hypothetical protein